MNVLVPGKDGEFVSDGLNYVINRKHAYDLQMCKGVMKYNFVVVFFSD